MGEIGDHGTVHFEVDLDGRTAQLGMGGGAGIGVGEAAEAGDIARQFDDSLVVDIVQHRSGSRAGLLKCPCGYLQGWKYLRKSLGGKVSASYIWTGTGEKQPGWFA